METINNNIIEKQEELIKSLKEENKISVGLIIKHEQLEIKAKEIIKTQTDLLNSFKKSFWNRLVFMFNYNAD
ncbi:MAG: hypothetical protein GY870_09515 [archaeon]|nr:hypothetical protein [archaeon]